MSVLPTTGRFSGSHLTSGLLPIRCQFFLANGQWNNSETFLLRLGICKCPSDFRFDKSEQILTAARPPRILTAFPFDYPALPMGHLAALRGRTGNWVILFSKSKGTTITPSGVCQIKNIFLILIRSQIDELCIRTKSDNYMVMFGYNFSFHC